MSEPFATSCQNTGRDDYWTCPGCYSDLGNVGEGLHQCSECGRNIRCTIIEQPVCLAEIEEASEDD